MKFTQAGQTRVSPVGEVDLGIYQLQRSERLLGERVEALAQEAERYGHQEQECVEGNKTPIAERFHPLQVLL